MRRLRGGYGEARWVREGYREATGWRYREARQENSVDDEAV
jgi:hypothetical protein